VQSYEWIEMYYKYAKNIGALSIEHFCGNFELFRHSHAFYQMHWLNKIVMRTPLDGLNAPKIQMLNKMRKSYSDSIKEITANLIQEFFCLKGYEFIPRLITLKKKLFYSINFIVSELLSYNFRRDSFS
jgi:hypothetical protein